MFYINTYKTKNLGVLNSVMFIGEAGSLIEAGLLEEIRYAHNSNSFSRQSSHSEFLDDIMLERKLMTQSRKYSNVKINVEMSKKN